MTSPGESLAPLISALPTGARMRYWRPAPALAGLVSGYHLYAVDPPVGERQTDVFQPAWPSLRFTFGKDARWRVRQPGESWRPVGARSLFGSSSRVRWSEAGCGLTIGIGLRPSGWARWSHLSADTWADRVGDPEGVFRFDVDALHSQVASLGDDEDVPKLFDSFLGSHAQRPSPRDALVAAVETALLDPQVSNVAALAQRAGVSVRTLERLSLRAFGFTPKLLMRRARFLRSLHAVAEAPVALRATAIDAAYTDYAHFVRDAHHFLGVSPQAFLKLDTPLLRQSLALRRQILGAPAQALAGDKSR